MKTIFIVLAIAAVVLLALFVEAAKRQGKGRALGPIKAKKPLTPREQGMFFRLQEAFPEHVVLSQVGMSALLSAKDTRTRNAFDRKVADFVLCTKAFDVLAVIELDDATHKGKEGKDAKRDEMLQRAGFKTLRFAQVPDALPLRRAVLAPVAEAKAA